MIIDEAFEVVKSKGPNHELIAKLGCELERAYAKNYRLDAENRNIRRSYSRLKRWFTRQFKYYKAHRDELLNEKEIRHKVDRPVVHITFKARSEESRLSDSGRSSGLVRQAGRNRLAYNSDKEQESGDKRCAGGT